MYQCTKCGQVSEYTMDGDVLTGRMYVRAPLRPPLRDSQLYEESYNLSPCCGAPVDWVEPCKQCDNPVLPSLMLHGICRSCAGRALQRMRYLLANEFTEAELRVLDEAFDGVALSEFPEARLPE